MIQLFSQVPTHAAASLSFELFKVFTLLQYLSRNSLYSCFSHSPVSSFSELRLPLIITTLHGYGRNGARVGLRILFQIGDSHHAKHHSRSLEKDLNVVDCIADSGHQESSTVALRRKVDKEISTMICTMSSITVT